MKQVLVLLFRNAGIFNPKFSKDHLLQKNWETGRTENIPRAQAPSMNVPTGTLSCRHISNLLHVLMGERPVPSLRKYNQKALWAQPDIKALAEGARVKIDTPLNDRGWYPREKQTVRKVASDSWSNSNSRITLAGKDQKFIGPVITWERLRVYLEKGGLYEEFRKLCSRLLGDGCFSGRAVEAVEKLSNMKSETAEFRAKCLASMRTPMARILDGTTYGALFHTLNDPRIRTTINKGVEDVSRINGVIYVPMDDEHLERVASGPGAASFLDGGTVFVAGTLPDSESLMSETVKPVE